MHPKPDIIRTLLFVFVIGLVVTGVTSLQAAGGDKRHVNVPDVKQLNAAVVTSQVLTSARDD